MEINFSLAAESAAMLTAFWKELRARKTYPGPHFPVSVKTKKLFRIAARI